MADLITQVRHFIMRNKILLFIYVSPRDPSFYFSYQAEYALYTNLSELQRFTYLIIRITFDKI